MISSADKLLPQIVEPLLKWYRENRRILPWREDPSPYHVWVSEIMLQQTRVEAVKSYYKRFIEALPDIKALALCPDDKLLKLWEGLGYYSRVKNMKKAAGEILSSYNGVLPKEPKQLKELSGIGDYTAGAIASIAYDVPVPAVDGNVLRVLSRVLCSEEDISLPATKNYFTQQLTAVEPSSGAGIFNQSLMELGATVCLPNGEPKCFLCPLRALCLARQEGKENLLPIKAPKKARRIEERTLFVFRITLQGKEYTLLHRRPSKGLLGGMWEFPALESCCSVLQAQEYAEDLAQSLGLSVDSITPLKAHKHLFTHIEWHMTAWEIKAQVKDSSAAAQHLRKLLPENGALVLCQSLDPENISEAIALPSAFRPYRDHLMK